MTIKIGVIVRARDEEHRVRQFCESYKDADKILLADGGSIDRTKELAKEFSNVEIRDFPGRTQMLNGLWRNNDSDHVNFLISWANECDFDWILWDDIDCVPNYLVRQDYRKILEETSQDFLMIRRLYLWGLDKHFPKMAEPGASIWGWRTTQDFWTINIPPAFDFRVGTVLVRDLAKQFKVKELEYPYCLLHFSWDDPERVKQKVKFYRESGLIPGQLHPLEFAGHLEPLPEFAHE
jgi:glycosyltransferase involved in cell wall biosynthesis